MLLLCFLFYLNSTFYFTDTAEIPAFIIVPFILTKYQYENDIID